MIKTVMSNVKKFFKKYFSNKNTQYEQARDKMARVKQILREDIKKASLEG